MSGIENISLRSPDLKDGMAVFNLIANCAPLDTNSSYCNLLQCSHFSTTSVVALQGDDVVGFISGYSIPDRPNTLFVWQVAVSQKARGLGLASLMLSHILHRPSNGHIEYLETSITEENQPSWKLFKSFAKKNRATFTSSEWMHKHTHFDGAHDSEWLVRIGPFITKTN